MQFSRWGSHKNAVEAQNHHPQPATPPFFDAAQDTVGSCPVFIHQHPQVLLHRAGFNPLITQPVSMFGITPTQAQDLTLGLVEIHKDCTGPALESLQVSLE